MGEALAICISERGRDPCEERVLGYMLDEEEAHIVNVRSPHRASATRW